MNSQLWDDVIDYCRKSMTIFSEIAEGELDPARQKLCYQMVDKADGVIYRMSEEVTQKTEIPGNAHG